MLITILALAFRLGKPMPLAPYLQAGLSVPENHVIMLSVSNKPIDSESPSERKDQPFSQDAASQREGSPQNKTVDSPASALPRRSAPKQFIPSEKIPADQAVDFPADI
jgi:hypothetical protein